MVTERKNLVKPLELLLKSNIILLPGQQNFPKTIKVYESTRNKHVISMSCNPLVVYSVKNHNIFLNGDSLEQDTLSKPCYHGYSFNLHNKSGVKKGSFLVFNQFTSLPYGRKFKKHKYADYFDKLASTYFYDEVASKLIYLASTNFKEYKRILDFSNIELGKPDFNGFSYFYTDLLKSKFDNKILTQKQHNNLLLKSNNKNKTFI